MIVHLVHTGLDYGPAIGSVHQGLGLSRASED